MSLMTYLALPLMPLLAVWAWTEYDIHPHTALLVAGGVMATAVCRDVLAWRQRDRATERPGPLKPPRTARPWAAADTH